jgi:hypothetical protein
MAPEIHWQAIALRLILTVIAGGLLGAERSRTGHAAGLRTTLLVRLAASVSMIQMNLLMPSNGKPHDSYAVMDLMRLPLGILTGVGFIGAGAIVCKNELVVASQPRQPCGSQPWSGCAWGADNWFSAPLPPPPDLWCCGAFPGLKVGWSAIKARNSDHDFPRLPFLRGPAGPVTSGEMPRKIALHHGLPQRRTQKARL